MRLTEALTIAVGKPNYTAYFRTTEGKIIELKTDEGQQEITVTPICVNGVRKTRIDKGLVCAEAFERDLQTKLIELARVCTEEEIQQLKKPPLLTAA